MPTITDALSPTRWQRTHTPAPSTHHFDSTDEDMDGEVEDEDEEATPPQCSFFNKFGYTGLLY